MSKPCLPKRKVRRAQINLRLRPGEEKLLRRAAGKQKLSDYIRSRILPSS